MDGAHDSGYFEWASKQVVKVELKAMTATAEELLL